MFDQNTIDNIIKNRIASGGSALAVLSDIQKELRYVPEEAIDYVARRMTEAGQPQDADQLRRQASFFHIFSTQSNGRHVIRICNGPCCTARGRAELIAAIQKGIGLKEGQITTNDGRFSLLPSGCMQGCASGPIMIVDDDRFSQVTAENVMNILSRYE